MARLGDATWHHKSVTLGIKGMAHNYPCVGMNPMAHNEPHESKMS